MFRDAADEASTAAFDDTPVGAWAPVRLQSPRQLPWLPSPPLAPAPSTTPCKADDRAYPEGDVRSKDSVSEERTGAGPGATHVGEVASHAQENV